MDFHTSSQILCFDTYVNMGNGRDKLKLNLMLKIKIELDVEMVVGNFSFESNIENARSFSRAFFHAETDKQLVHSHQVFTVLLLITFVAKRL